MKKNLKGALALFLVVSVLFGIAGCNGADKNYNSSIGSTASTESEQSSFAADAEQGVLSSVIAAPEQDVQSTQSEHKSDSSNITNSEQSKISLNEGGDKNVASVSSKKSSSGSKQSSDKVSTTPAVERDKSLYRIDYIFKNSVYKNEYNNRGGLYNTLYKLQKGEDITIAYLGGSITELDGWRVYTTKWFEENFSGKVKEIDAGLSSTGADLGVYRIDDEVLAHNPDLVFIEYAVNGGTAKAMEGMVLKTWKHDPTIDICFVYTTAMSNYSLYKSGERTKYDKIYENVAEHYGIPSVFFGNQVFDLYERGELVFSGEAEKNGQIVCTTDGTHHTAEGGNLAAGAIARSIRNMEKSFNKNSYAISKHKLPLKTYVQTPLTDAISTSDWSKMKFSGSWLDCSLTEEGSLKNFNYSGGFLYLIKKLFLCIRGTKVAGSSITVRFKGTEIGVFEVGGQYSGQLRVIVDGIECENKLVLFNQTYDSKLRHQYKFIDPLPYGEHTVTFILDSKTPDKSILQNMFSYDKTYEKNEFYLGKILINGELLDANK